MGKPAPQGSKRSLGGRVMIESSKRCKPWRQDVRHAALDLTPEAWRAPLPMKVEVAFLFNRPKADYRVNGEQKPTAPHHLTKRVGDVDKLCRVLLDAMTGVVFNDDCQVVTLIANRRFCLSHERPSAIITVTALG